MNNSFSQLSTNEIQRYARHIVIPEVGLEGQLRLKASSVLLAGTGGLGSPIALYLAAAGVGRIGLVDYDTVSISNLQRQVIHDTSHLGQLKVDSAGERLVEINPDIQIETFSEPYTSKNAETISRGYDILVDGTDNFATRYLLNDLAVLTRKPYVYGSIFRFQGQVAVFDSRQGPCYRCLFPQPPPPESVPSCSTGGVFGVLPGTIGTLQAAEVIKLILGIGEPLIGKLLIYDALEMSFQTVLVPKNPACPVCGENPVIRQLVDYDEFCGTPPIGTPSVLLPHELEISPHHLAERLSGGEQITLLDVRLPGERLISNLPGSIPIPIDELPHRLAELNPAIPIVAYCRKGIRSARAVLFLKDIGFSKVWNLSGGINGWADEMDPDMPKY